MFMDCDAGQPPLLRRQMPCVIILMHAAGSSPTNLHNRVQMEVPDTLLRSEFVTENAEEADYFFVDAWFYNARLSIVRDSKPS